MKWIFPSHDVSQNARGGRAKDGRSKMSVAMSGRLVPVEPMASGRAARWRLPGLLAGILRAHGRRAVTTWLRAAGVSIDFQDDYYFLAAFGPKVGFVAGRLLLLVLRTVPLLDRILAVLDDMPTQRYGPHVEGAGIHRNPTPGPADQKDLYGHIWVALSPACGIRASAPWPCPCARCSTSDGRRWPPSRPGAVERLSPNSCWVRAWSNGLRPWSNKPGKRCGS